MVNEYGNFPGVKARVVGGGVNGVVIGVEQKLVIFGRGDPDDGSASYNEPREIRTQAAATREFGEGTELAEGIQKALSNGANSEYVYGVMPTEIEVNGETISGSGSLGGDIDNVGPVIEDENAYNATEVASDEPVDVNLRYESPPEEPISGVNVNPNTREVTGAPDSDGNSVDYSLTWSYLEWSTAMEQANRVVNHNETGVLCALSDAVTVAQDITDKVDDIRPDYKLVRGVVGAQPNKTSDEGLPKINTSEFINQIDNDSVFMAGPVRLRNDPTKTILGAISGHFAGNELTNPVFHDNIRGHDSLAQEVNKTEERELTNNNVIPVRDSSLDGELGIRLQSNTSTSTATEWNRDYHRRRAVDQVLLIGREIGEQAVSEILTPSYLTYLESLLRSELIRLANANVIQENPQTDGEEIAEEEQKYSVTVTQSGPDTIGIELAVTPTGVVKRVDETIVVSDN